jgi:hypothetical protein
VQEEFDFEEALKKFNKDQLGKEAGEEHVSVWVDSSCAV